MISNYDKYPAISISSNPEDCASGWESIAERLRHALADQAATIVCIECYPGVLHGDIASNLSTLLPQAKIVPTFPCLKPAREIDAMLWPDLTDDPVFSRLTNLELSDFFRPDQLGLITPGDASNHVTLVIGIGAVLIAPQFDLLIYADLPRWEIQQRQRRGEIGNLGANGTEGSASAKYKRGFFVDWRVADRLKKKLLPKIDFLLDTTQSAEPKMIPGNLFRDALQQTARRPFRLVPFFDPGPWGGQWMRNVCALPDGPPNYAWCFDCVPEENSLLFGFGSQRIEVPALNLVLSHPRELLGDAVHSRFGTEFPIRFDFLDTMGGGNLSLQVHPLTEYIQQHFGMQYTQDESYYLLDADEDACVYLGLREGVNRDQMVCELSHAQEHGAPFPADAYVNCWAAKKHDHFLIPAGTIHCSGRNSMVLEISATPYIFTFKLWDWGRMGLDGRPRPIHLKHGIANIQWDRTTNWVRNQLVNQVQEIASGDGWREERTGLHEREFIETRRHWYTGTVPHDTAGLVNVLNLVEGSEAIIESPSGQFHPLVVHYAETFVIPAAVGPYTIRPTSKTSKPQATVKAFVRTRA